MVTLGETGKSDPRQFENKRKLFLVPMLPTTLDFESNTTELLDSHWEQIKNQLDNLEKSLGTIKHVFHEMLHLEDEPGMQLLSQISPRSQLLTKKIVDSSGNLHATENVDLLYEMMDLQRCLSVGLISQRIHTELSDNFSKTSNSRNLHISDTIDSKLLVNEIGLLFISEDHKIQFASDIQVFYVSPPSFNKIKQALEDYSQHVESAVDDSKEIT
jgi:hypothetical protein